MNTSIVSAEWLHNNLNTENLIILDCTLINQLLKLPEEATWLEIRRFFTKYFLLSS